MTPSKTGTEIMIPDAWMLGIDTSTERAGLALGNAARVFTRDCDGPDDNCWTAEPSRQLRGFRERRRLKAYLQ